MNSTGIKEKLHSYIDTGDDKLLNLLFALAQEYTKDENYEIDEEELISLEQRRTDRLSGKSKTYSWEEAKKAVLNSGKLEQ